MFISSEFNKILKFRVGNNSTEILSPMRNQSRDARDLPTKLLLNRTSFPVTYQTFAGILFIVEGMFFRTCSSAKLRSVAPIFRHPAYSKLTSPILISNGSPITSCRSEKTRHRERAGDGVLTREAIVQFCINETLPEMQDQRCLDSSAGWITEVAWRLTEFSLVAYGARISG